MSDESKVVPMMLNQISKLSLSGITFKMIDDEEVDFKHFEILQCTSIN